MSICVTLLALTLALAGPFLSAADAAAPAAGDCAGPGGERPSRCIYRSLLPSAGVVADCKTDRDCRVGFYYGDIEHPTWLDLPPGTPSFAKPAVIWRTATLAESRFSCGGPCTVSYFFEARRRRISPPRWFVLDVDTRRLLLVAAEDRAIVVRQVFSGREVARIERPWAPGGWLGEVVTAARFDPDGRLSLTWLRNPDRIPVSERISVPSTPR